jgi:hypothetical protein
LSSNDPESSAGYAYFYRLAPKACKLFARNSGNKGIAASFECKMKIIVCIFLVLCISQSAYSQISSGTVIIFQLIHNKFIVAADSRGIFKRVPDDTYCKIAAFDQQVVFAVSGGPSYVPGNPDTAPAWSAIEETGKAITVTASKKQRDSVSRVNSIADTWASSMITNWWTLNLIHPEMVGQYAAGNGSLTTGIFAAASHGSVSLTARAILLKDGVMTVVRLDEDCRTGPCVSGMPDIFAEFILGKTERAKKEAQTSLSLPKGMSREMAHIIRLVDLTIMYDPTKVVGGPIDAVTLSGNGNIHWAKGHRKNQCPEKQK